MEAEAISFSAAAEKMQAFSSQIEDSLHNITETVKEVSLTSAAGISELASTTRKVQKLAIDIAAKLERLDQLQHMLNGILNTSEALGIFKETTETTAASLSKLTTTSIESSRKLDSEVIQPLSESGVASGLLQLTKSFPDNATTLASSIRDLTAEANNLTKALASHRHSVEQSISTAITASEAASHLKGLEQTAKSVTYGMSQLLGSINELKININAASEVARKISVPSQIAAETKIA